MDVAKNKKKNYTRHLVTPCRKKFNKKSVSLVINEIVLNYSLSVSYTHVMFTTWIIIDYKNSNNPFRTVQYVSMPIHSYFYRSDVPETLGVHELSAIDEWVS